MAKPPPSPPSSDIEGVNRDARAGKPSSESRPDSGAAIDHAKTHSTARPLEGKPQE